MASRILEDKICVLGLGLDGPVLGLGLGLVGAGLGLGLGLRILALTTSLLFSDEQWRRQDLRFGGAVLPL